MQADLQQKCSWDAAEMQQEADWFHSLWRDAKEFDGRADHPVTPPRAPRASLHRD